ncbi:unnamed protein product, partial [marine sediment metagenome]
FPLYNLDFGEIREKQYELLKSLNVKYITLHEDAFPYKVSPYPCRFTFKNLRASKYLKLVASEYPVWLFEVVDTPVANSSDIFQQTSTMGVVYEVERLPYKTGSRVDDPQASEGTAAFGKANRDDKDYLFFGPYRTFPTGKYNVIFRLKAGDSTTHAEVAKIDISTGRGRTVLSERALRGTDFSAANRYQDFLIPVDLNEPTRLEFRAYFCGNADLWADYVYICFRDQEDPAKSYEAEELFPIGLVKSDPDASSGEALFVGGGKEFEFG